MTDPTKPTTMADIFAEEDAERVAALTRAQTPGTPEYAAEQALNAANRARWDEDLRKMASEPDTEEEVEEDEDEEDEDDEENEDESDESDDD